MCRTSEVLKAEAEAAFRAALAAVDPAPRVADWLRAHPEAARPKGRLYTIAVGKAAMAMVRGAGQARALDPKQVLVVTKTGHGLRGPPWVGALRLAGHPTPDQRSLAAGAEILKLAEDLGARDELLLLISGGASALAEALPEEIPVEDWLTADANLVSGGLPIQTINTVRKHCSHLKGGQLARAADPARVTALLVSDVIGDDPAVIGSGPAAGDPSSFADALAAIRNWGNFPDSVRRYLAQGHAGGHPETPLPEELENACNIVVVHNRMALAEANRFLAEKGYRTLILSHRLQGEAQEVARVLAAVALGSRETGCYPSVPPAAFLWGGETTVTLDGAGGEGGRNQELALAMASDLAGWSGIAALCAGTDGNDGPTEAAGGWVDGTTARRAADKGLDRDYALANHDSGSLLEALGDRLVTGPTGTNVMDLALLLVGEEAERED